eukprot:365534-Chlamydomonas_euryale.AAC.3
MQLSRQHEHAVVVALERHPHTARVGLCMLLPPDHRVTDARVGREAAAAIGQRPHAWERHVDHGAGAGVEARAATAAGVVQASEADAAGAAGAAGQEATHLLRAHARVSAELGCAGRRRRVRIHVGLTGGLARCGVKVWVGHGLCAHACAGSGLEGGQGVTSLRRKRIVGFCV